MEIGNTVRQGDVLLKRLSGLPKTAKVKQKRGSIVLALGEATGHMHQIKSGAVLYEWDGNSLIKVNKTTELVHEEHSAITLTPGVYQRIIQREYSPGAIRTVED
jgi:hypothetical protein